MPKKPRSTGPTGPASPPVAPASARPRPSLLERMRSEQTAQFHSPERARLMVSEAGGEAYAAVRLDLPLHERLRLFERIAEDAIQAYTLQVLACHRHGDEYHAAERAHHRQLLAPLLDGWRAAAQTLDVLGAQAAGAEVTRALGLAAGQVRSLVVSASDGRAADAAQALDRLRDLLEQAVTAFESAGQAELAARCRAIHRTIRAGWPASGLLANVVTKGLRDSIAASEVTQDLQAIVRWFAPVLAQECVAAGLDPSVVREVGSTMSRAGGGPPHLATAWPEQRARLQVLGDQAARPLPQRVGQRSRVGQSAGPRITPHAAQLSWKELHHFLRDEARGNGGLDGSLPPSPGALRKAAERGKPPWAPLRKDRTRATARRVLELLRES